MSVYVLRDYLLAHQQLSLAEMDIEHPGSFDISSFGEQKRPVKNSLQNGIRDQQYCMKINLALLIPTIYVTHIIQKWHLEQNGSHVTNYCTEKYWKLIFNKGQYHSKSYVKPK